MFMTRILVVASCLVVLVQSTATVQGSCISGDAGLSWLASQLSPQAVISCLGSPLQLYNAGRYWGMQYAKNASVVVFPVTPEEVSITMRATSKTPLGTNFAFVGGGHGQTNASSSYDFVIDLSYLNKTEILHDFQVDGKNMTVVAYQGGATAGSVNSDTSGSGYAALMARVSSVGVGGFTTGGGIGFLAGAYGYATDRLRAVQVVLPSGQIVLATKKNQYSDLFWALHGGNGQFGICTTFYQEAIPEPLSVSVAAYFLPNDAITSQQAINNTVAWFAQNKDPFSLMYWATGVLPSSFARDPSTFAVRPLIISLQVNNPTTAATPKQANFSMTFARLTQDLPINASNSLQLTVPYAALSSLFDPFYPYGARRGFWGGEVSNITTSYLTSVAAEFQLYIEGLAQHGETSALATSLWAIQYMHPGLNGNLPVSDDATAWPHHNAGHQTLFSPSWAKAENDIFTDAANDVFNTLNFQQEQLTGPFLGDYPNYMSPGEPASRIFGDNVKRLIDIKQKYDPCCQLHSGRVFATKGCRKRGFSGTGYFLP